VVAISVVAAAQQPEVVVISVRAAAQPQEVVATRMVT
jgi:hypothetical protein